MCLCLTMAGPFHVLKHYVENFPDFLQVQHGEGSLHAATLGPLNEKIIVFLSPRMTEVMMNSKEIVTSFQKVHATRNKNEVLLIYQISRISNDDSVTSLVQAVIEKPSHAAIRNLLLFVKEAIPDFSPLIAHLGRSEYERAAWEEVFACQISLTYTSFSNAILRTIAKMQLTHAMELNTDVRNLLTSFLAIPCMPRTHMLSGAYHLIKRSAKLGHFDRLEPFFTKFMSTWMKGETLETLSMYNNSINNAQEVAVENLVAVMGPSYPDVLNFIRAMRQYEWLSYSGFGSKVVTLPNEIIIGNCAKLCSGGISLKKYLLEMSDVLVNCFF